MSEHHPSPDHFFRETTDTFYLAQRLSDLPPSVERRKKSLVEEILGLCRKHGFSHPKELDLTSKIPLKDLETMNRLLEKLLYVVTHRELPKGEKAPLDDKEYTIELPPDSDVISVLDDHGRPIIAGYQRGLDFFLKDALGYERSLGPEVHEVNLASIQGQPVVIEKDDEMKRSIRHINGEPFKGLTGSYSSISTNREGEIDHVMTGDLAMYAVGQKGRLGRPKGYAFVEKTVRVGEQTYFFAKEKQNSERELYDEEGVVVEVQGPRDDLLQLVEMNGNLVVCVRKNGRHFFVDTQGELLEDEDKDGFNDVYLTKVLDGKIYFLDSHEKRGGGDTFCCHTDHEAIFSIPRNVQVMDFTKIGDRFFLLTSDSWRHNLYCFPPLETFHRGLKRAEFFVKDVSVLPIGVGDHMIFEKEGKIFIDHSAGELQMSFQNVYALEPLDEYRWYVIGKQDGNVVKRVFDTRALSFV